MRTVWKTKYIVLWKAAAEREWLGYKGVGQVHISTGDFQREEENPQLCGSALPAPRWKDWP